MSKEFDVSCFSYLASARVLQIEEYPSLNGGAEIDRVINTLSADAPMVAIAAARLGLNSNLIANSLGDDEQGVAISATLKQHGVHTGIECRPDRKTPFIIVLSDKGENREWFSYTQEVRSELKTVDLSLIGRSAIAYVDLYTATREAALRAMDYATQAGTEVFLNLSANLPDPELAARLANTRPTIVQLSIQEGQKDAASTLERLHEILRPKISIVTAGSKGALALAEGENAISNPAYAINVVHLHGAGAAFSAGFLFGYQQKWSTERCLEFACALGSLSCSKERGFEQVARQEIDDLIAKGKM